MGVNAPGFIILLVREGQTMEIATVAAIGIVSLALKGAAYLMLAYVGARLAIRHERRSQTG